ncbi:hexamerin-like [Lycorma delicatula]|uniref:hexamerin-like n=1 Tax=Lycorma delicatula TaxID=130591 RepID=UPI003F51504D
MPGGEGVTVIMKYSATLLLAVFSLTAASVLQKKEDVAGYNNYNNNNQNNNNNNGYNNQGYQQFFEKQFDVVRLLSNLQHNNPYHDLVQLGRNFNPFRNVNRFYNQPAVNHFLNNFAQNNFLPNDEVFTPTSQQHQNQAAQLFHFFYSAQDWNTFKAAAAWARERFNPQQFAYAFSAAVLNHPATQGVVVPALYEVVPHDFVPATAFHQIYKAKFQGYQFANVFANYTNQNENNEYYSYFYNNNNGQNNNNNNENYGNYGPHNPNAVFAVNDGSQDNNAGTPENPENRVSYFTEDVGINAYHAGFHVQNPAFFGANNNNDYFDTIFNNNYNNNNQNYNNNNNYYYNYKATKRGEAFYYAHQQFYARYVLERLSNNLPIPQPINFNDKIQPGYNPNLQYANGQAVPARPPNTYFQQQQKNSNNNNNNAQEPNNNQAQNPQVYEQRLQEVADTGFVVNPDGSKTNIYNQYGIGVLANIAANPADSPNSAYYGNYFAAGKNAIGFIVDPNNQNGVAPGPAANYATAPRDPAYYQFLAKLNQIFYNFQNNLGPYSPNEINFPGVKIQSFDVSRLVTYFDYFNVNVDNAVNNHNNNNNNNNNDNQNFNNNNGQYNVKFQRLTNQPFNYKLNVQSNRNANAVVRVFIGPKYDSNGQQFTLPQASQYFVQLDQFTVRLNNGQNVFQRNSQQSPLYVSDAPSFQQIYNQLQQAKQGNQPFYGNQAGNSFWGFPKRAQLPKGKASGQEFVFYAIITEANPNNNNYVNFNNNQNYNNQSDSNNQNNNNQSDSNNQNDNSQFDNDNQFYNNNNQYNDNNNQNNNADYYNNPVYDIQFYDNKSLGFPFNRPVQDAYYSTPNQYFKTVTIYHKSQHNNN